MLTPDIFVEQKKEIIGTISIFGAELIGDVRRFVMREFTEQQSVAMFKDINIGFKYATGDTFYGNIETITEFKTVSYLEIWVVDQPMVKIPIAAIPELSDAHDARQMQLLIRLNGKEREKYIENESHIFPYPTFRLPMGLRLSEHENYEIKVNMKNTVHFKDRMTFYCIFW